MRALKKVFIATCTDKTADSHTNEDEIMGVEDGNIFSMLNTM